MASKHERKNTSFTYVTERNHKGDSTKKNSILFSDDEVYDIEGEAENIAAYVITNKRRFYIDHDDYNDYLRILS